MAESEFACEFCGQELKNYKIRLHPAKKMPKKSLNLYHNPALQLQASSTFNSNQSSFAKYFHRVSMPKNMLEIECKTCSKSTSITALKPKYNPPKTSTPRSERRQKKGKKTPQDLNAGLIIPSSMGSPSTPLDFRPNRSSRSSLFAHQETPKLRQVDGSNDYDPSHPSLKMNNKKIRKMIQGQKMNKQKDIYQLQKALFKSKEMNSSGSTSLDRFLDQ